MDTDTELETWRRQWQTRDTVPLDLKEKVERGTRQLRRARAGEIGVTVIMGGGSAAWALLSQRPDALILAIGIWVFIGVAWATSIALRRDLLKPLAETNAAFLDLSILRARRHLLAIAANSVLYVMILTFDLAWIYYRRAETEFVGPLAFLTSGRAFAVWVVSAVLAIVAVQYGRRLRRELQNLLRLRQQLGDGPDSPPAVGR